MLLVSNMFKRPIIRRVGRMFSNGREPIEFPYIFNNRLVQEPKPRVEFGPKNVLAGIRMAYRALLTSIAEGNVSDLDKAVEGRLFKKLSTDYKALLDTGHKFLLRNPESEIKASIKEINFIIGGYIDRETEYSKGIIQVPTLRNTLFYKNPSGKPQYVLSKVQANVKTNFKLDLKFPNGEMLIPSEDLELEEQHEIIIEGICHDMAKAGLIRGSLKMMWSSYKKELPMDDVTIVDLDNALKGNCHKDSVGI